jgi:hypothetical protein
MSWSPSPYPYPTNTPSSAPFSFSYHPTPMISASPEVIVSYVPMQTTYSASPGPRVHPLSISANSTILSHVSNDAFYGIICAIAFVIIYTSSYSVYYYKKYKKEKIAVMRLSDFNGKSHANVRTVLNPSYPV